MKAKLIRITLTALAIAGAFLLGKSAQEPSIPLSDVADYYVNGNGILTIEMQDIRSIHDNWNEPIYTNYLASENIPDITYEMENNLLDLSTVDNYEANGNTLTLYANGNAYEFN